ncbi:MAG TPA: hypothetical protein VFC94_06935 [Bacteroidaceae bacterium]|nr:hypothetical protein [Bacteroidaceae bacterium]
MTEEDSKTIIAFENKLKQFIGMYENLKNLNSDLSKLLENKELELEKLRCRLERIEKDYQNLKLAKVMSVSGKDIDQARMRISKLVREVDHCIELLNV